MLETVPVTVYFTFDVVVLVVVEFVAAPEPFPGLPLPPPPHPATTASVAVASSIDASRKNVRILSIMLNPATRCMGRAKGLFLRKSSQSRGC